jgi:hypothetical protein
MINRQSGVKMFLSAITAPIVLAHLIDFLIRRCYVSPLQIWSATPIQDMNTSAPIYWRCHVISANTIGVVNVHVVGENCTVLRTASCTAHLRQQHSFILPDCTVYTCLYILHTVLHILPQYLNRQSRSNGKLVLSYWPKFAPLRLFVETMPIYKAVATGNGKNDF